MEELDRTEAVAEESSEFGAGIVVCLAKFSEHLWNDRETRIQHAIWWSKRSEEEREAQRAEAERFPSGDAARRLMDVDSSIYRTPEEALSNQIEMWMNGASDHFYDLDREKSPPALCELADLTLRIGHGFTGEPWTAETVIEIRQLWKQACLEVDALLGVKADWGAW